MENKKRSIWFSLLIYLCIGVVAALLIYTIVDRATEKYTAVSSETGIKYIRDKEDNKTITAAYVEINGSEATVMLDLKDTENKNYYYTFTMYAGPWADPASNSYFVAIGSVGDTIQDGQSYNLYELICMFNDN